MTNLHTHTCAKMYASTQQGLNTWLNHTAANMLAGSSPVAGKSTYMPYSIASQCICIYTGKRAAHMVLHPGCARMYTSCKTPCMH